MKRYSIRMFTRRRFLQTPRRARGVSPAPAAFAAVPVRARRRLGLSVAGRRGAVDAAHRRARSGSRCRCAGKSPPTRRCSPSSRRATAQAEPALGALGARRGAGARSPSAGTGTASPPAMRKAAIGRTRTAPAASAANPRLRFAFASCQQYEQGYFNAYRHIAADAPDLVAFLGDYIYESSWGRDHVRKHGAAEPYTLEDYRARHALYRCDPDLQAAHAACPWIVTWDDHEVDNDYADDRPEDGMERDAVPRAARRRLPRLLRAHAAAARACSPVGRTCASTRTSTGARLARFYDRSTHASTARGRPARVPAGAAARTPSTSRSARACRCPGARCSGARRSAGSSARSPNRARPGTSLAQTTPMAQLRPASPAPGGAPGPTAGTAIRRRASACSRPSRRTRCRNPVVLGGDVHSFNVNQLKTRLRRPGVAGRGERVRRHLDHLAGLVAGAPRPVPARQPAHAAGRQPLPRLRARRAHARSAVQTDLRAMESVQRRDAACSTLATFVVEDGRPGPCGRRKHAQHAHSCSGSGPRGISPPRQARRSSVRR